MFAAEFREDVRVTIPAIVDRLKDSVWYVRKAAVDLFSGLLAQGICQHPFLLGVLKHDSS